MTKKKWPDGDRADYFIAPPESVVVLEEGEHPRPWELFPDDRTDEEKAMAERVARGEDVDDTGEDET